jgi:hypothetical protein
MGTGSRDEASMTLIIAHRSGWMVADRRVTFQDSLIGPYVVSKIKRGSGILVASSGNGVFKDLIVESIDGGLPAIAKLFRENGREIGGHALARTAAGICEVTSRGGLEWVDSDFWAIGSGYQFGLGWLAAVASTRPVVPDDAKHAINYAATRVSDVGDGHQLEIL